MKKTIIAFTLLSTLATSFSAHATIGSFTGNPNTIMGGICMTYAGFKTTFTRDDGYNVFWGLGFLLLGITLLDSEDGQSVQFKEVDHEQLLKMGLTEEEAEAYNQNTEELTEAYKIVGSKLNKDSSLIDSKRLWDEQAQIIGEDTISGARKVILFNLK